MCLLRPKLGEPYISPKSENPRQRTQVGDIVVLESQLSSLPTSMLLNPEDAFLSSPSVTTQKLSAQLTPPFF